MAKLTDKQEKFVQELIKGRTQREAYKFAGYKVNRMTDNTIDVEASKLLKNPKVSLRYNELINRLIKEAEDECIADAKSVLGEVAKIAFAKGTDFARVVTKTAIDPNTGIKVDYKVIEIVDTDDVPEHKKSAIALLKETKFGIVVETHDKLKALELLGKHLRLWDGKQESTEEIEDDGFLEAIDNREVDWNE